MVHTKMRAKSQQAQGQSRASRLVFRLDGNALCGLSSTIGLPSRHVHAPHRAHIASMSVESGNAAAIKAR